MATLHIRPRALRDLAELWAYADDSESQADAFVSFVDAKLQTLARNPLLGRLRPELAADLRSFPVRQYVIFYRALSRGVEIVRVLHGARDLEIALDEPE